LKILERKNLCYRVDTKGEFHHNSCVEGMGGISHGESDFREYLEKLWDGSGGKGF
jgi:hypothetical protein